MMQPEIWASDEAGTLPGHVPVRSGDRTEYRALDLPASLRLGPLRGAYRPGFFRIRMEVTDQHANFAGFCSGGVLGELADISLGMALNASRGRMTALPTVSMELGFVRSVRTGKPVVATAEAVRVARTLGFSRALLWQAGEIVLRASGVFQIPEAGAADLGTVEVIFGPTGTLEERS